MKIAIFDLDQTVNTTSARNHLIPSNIRDNKAWAAWHEAFASERVCEDMVQNAKQLHEEGYRIFVVSNRMDYLGTATAKHLHSYGFPSAHYVLRSVDDNRKPDDWKANTIAILLATIREGHVVYFDDSKKAVEAVHAFMSKRDKVAFDGFVVRLTEEQETAPNERSKHTIKEVRF